MHYRQARLQSSIGRLALSVMVLLILALAAQVAAQAPTSGMEVPPDATGAIPSVPPYGESQANWDRRVQECRELNVEADRREKLTPEEQAELPPLPLGWSKRCIDMVQPFYNPKLPPNTITAPTPVIYVHPRPLEQ